MVNPSAPALQAGGDHVYRKLDELSAMHMRTREDVVETKVLVKALAENQAGQARAFSKHQEDVDRRFKTHAEETDGKLNEIAAQVTTIHEERIAEKAQWRGPEKVVAVISAIAALLGLAIAVKTLWFS